MIDIHSHLLPGIDDGAATIEQSLQLARHAVADGITHMVITPHIQPGVYDNDIASITTAFERFRAMLLKHSIALHVAMAAEVRICPEIFTMLDMGAVPLLVAADGERTMLLELPHSHVPPGTEKMLQWLIDQGIRVLIAHPERNKGILKDYSRAGRLVDLGCMLQLTSGSLSGRFGMPPQQAARYMLEQGWVSVLATDAHNMRSRPPELSDGLAAARALAGEVVAKKLVESAPWSIVGGMFGRS